MDYEKLYYKLCYSRQALNRQHIKGDGLESHHIKPRAIGGSNDASNLVLLTAKEHLFAHWFLAKAKNEAWRWRALAAFAMCNDWHNRQYTTNQIAAIREASTKGRANVPKSAEHKAKLAEHLTKLNRNRIGEPLSEEHKANLSKASHGWAWINANRQPLSAERLEQCRQTMLEAMKGKPKKRSSILLAQLNKQKLNLAKREAFAQEYFALIAGFACPLPEIISNEGLPEIASFLKAKSNKSRIAKSSSARKINATEKYAEIFQAYAPLLLEKNNKQIYCCDGRAIIDFCRQQSFKPANFKGLLDRHRSSFNHWRIVAGSPML